MSIGSALAAWWLIGDQSVPNRSDLVYLVGPWPLPPGVEVLLGCLGLLTVGIGILVLLMSRAPIGWSVAAGLAGLGGYLLAYIERWETAGVIGSPIGAVLLLSGLPVVLALLSAAAFLAWVLGRRRPAAAA